MKVTINIQGSSASVSGSGTYSSGDNVSLEAFPSAVSVFSKWDIDGKIVEENPYEFVAGDSNVFAIAYFFMPIEKYLRNRVGFELKEEQIDVVVVGRGIQPGADVKTVSEKQKDLAYADLIMLIVTSQSEGAEEDKMGNWQHKGKSKTITGRRDLIALANSIYTKYGIKNGSRLINDKTNRW